MKESVGSELGLLKSDSFLEPRDGVNPPEVIAGLQRRMISADVPVQIHSNLRADGQGKPDGASSGRTQAGKFPCGHAHNCYLNVVEPDGSPYYGGIATERTLPVSISEDCDRRSAGHIVGRTERSPDGCSDAKRFKKITGNHFASHKTGWAVASQVERHVAG